MLQIDTHIMIPFAEFAISYARSSGPGGQNVNKVNSKAVLTWNIFASPSLPYDVKQRFLQKYASKITTDGAIVIASDQYRDQKRNLDDCFAKLEALLVAVARPPKARRPTKPSKNAVKKRLDTKKSHGDKKRDRKKVFY